MEIVVRNPAFNYRTSIKTVNKVYNKQAFGMNELNSLRQIIKGKAKEMRKEED
jgi:hypothetical protein